MSYHMLQVSTHSRLAAGYGIALLAALLMNQFFRGGAQGNTP